MPREVSTTQAQRQRDEGLARARRITWWTAIGAAGMTALAAGIAANTIPGHTVGAQSTNAGSGSTDNTGSTGTDPNAAGGGFDSGSGSFNPPAQQPQPGVGSGPAVVSGGS